MVQVAEKSRTSQDRFHLKSNPPQLVKGAVVRLQALRVDDLPVRVHSAQIGKKM